MAKLPSPFTSLNCPVCGVTVERVTGGEVVAHLQATHPSASRVNVYHELSDGLGLSLMDNLSGLTNDALEQAIESLCQYKALRQGLGRL